MVIRFTPQGCKVDTAYIIQPNNTYREEIVLSVDPASQLALAVEESAGQAIGPRVAEIRSGRRVRATRFGFELVERRP
jgi:hypothetical protein